VESKSRRSKDDKEEEMRRSIAQFVAVFAVVAMVAVAALAEKKSATVVLDNDTIVNGTTVKAGTYKAQFDFKTDTLSLMKENGKVVATAPGTIQDRPAKADHTQIVTDLQGKDQVMTSITFSGDHRTIMITGGPKAAGGER